MSVIGEVVYGLKAMSLMQLLFAFIACIGYQLAQGSLLEPRGRYMAWAVAAAGALGFTFQGADWTHSAMLVAFGIAGLGLFGLAVWITCQLIGIDRTPRRIRARWRLPLVRIRARRWPPKHRAPV